MNFAKYIKLLNYNNNSLWLEELDLCRLVPIDPACLSSFFDIFLNIVDKKENLILNKNAETDELWVKEEYKEYYKKEIIRCAYMRCNSMGINLCKECYYRRDLKECIDKLSNDLVRKGNIHTIVPFDGEYMLFEADYPPITNEQINAIIDDILINKLNNVSQKIK